MQQRLRKKLEEREQELLKKQCHFMYDQKYLKGKKIDLRPFEKGERICIRNDDGKLTLGEYVGMNTATAFRGTVSTTFTIHTARQDGKHYAAGIDGDPFRAQEIGTYDPTKKGGRTRRNRRRKATRRR